MVCFQKSNRFLSIPLSFTHTNTGICVCVCEIIHNTTSVHAKLLNLEDLSLQAMTISTWWRQGCLFFKKIWIIPQRYVLSAKYFPNFSSTSKVTGVVDPSLTLSFFFFFFFFLWGATYVQHSLLVRMCLLVRTGVSEAGKFCIFKTGIMQFGEYLCPDFAFWEKFWLKFC